jgi:mitogen-activated protein kinase 1/3/mitogen-activated protein kinase 6
VDLVLWITLILLAEKAMPLRGCDGEVGNYVVHGTKFEAPKRYTVLEPVGQGAYGVVCSAQDEEAGEPVAIKKVENAFEHLTFAKRTLRELKILRHLRHENLIDVRLVYLPGEKDKFEDIYIISELMETDLASVLKSPQPLSDDHSQFFFYQINRGLKYIHSASVIHRDLKPRNLLVNSNCDLKICDYGLARVRYPNEVFATCPMTEYVCTRWYRAPEVLSSWADFGKPIDLWSVGCIFAEMLRRKPLFPGKNTQHQLQLIIACLGTPDKDVLTRIPNDKCRKFIESLPGAHAKPFVDAFDSASPEAIDILNKTLCFSPEKRISAEKTLEHPYLALLHCQEDEPTRTPLDTADFEFERRKIDMEALREEIFLEALRYNPQAQQQYLAHQKKKKTAYDVGTYRLLHPGESQYSSDEEGG